MYEQIAVVTRWFATALLAGATVLYAYQFLMKRDSLAWWARFATGAGFLTLTASIGLRSIATGGTELTGYNQLVLLAWALLLVYFVVEHLIKVKVYGALLVPVSLLLLVVGEFLASTQEHGLTPREFELVDDWRIGIHVALIVFANAGFLVGGAASALYLLLDRQLKSRKTSGWARRLPSLAQAQTVARRAIVLAFPAYSAGLLLGTIRAIEEVERWWFDPRVMLSGVVWLIFGAYLLLLYRHEVSGRRAAWIAIVGLAAVAVLAVLARTVQSGFHVFGL